LIKKDTGGDPSEGGEERRLRFGRDEDQRKKGMARKKAKERADEANVSRQFRNGLKRVERLGTGCG